VSAVLRAVEGLAGAPPPVGAAGTGACGDDRRGELTEAEAQALDKLGVAGLRRSHARGTRRPDDAEQWLALARLVKPLDAARAALHHDDVADLRRASRDGYVFDQAAEFGSDPGFVVPGSGRVVST
jgi:hypothetical protein